MRRSSGVIGRRLLSSAIPKQVLGNPIVLEGYPRQTLINSQYGVIDGTLKGSKRWMSNSSLRLSRDNRDKPPKDKKGKDKEKEKEKGQEKENDNDIDTQKLKEKNTNDISEDGKGKTKVPSNEKVESSQEESLKDEKKSQKTELKNSAEKKVSSVGGSPVEKDEIGVEELEKKNEEKKNQIPKIYPQMLALPISRRPLFPGFYKAVVVSDPRVMKVIKEMLDRQQPYIAAFMLKDSELDTDVIRSEDEVYKTGVFAQITSAFPSKDEKTGAETLTALIYPHKRVKIDKLIPPIEKDFEDNKVEQLAAGKKNEVSQENSVKVVHVENENKLLEEVDEEEDESNPTKFLKKHNVSLVNVSNLEDEPFDRKSPVINALTSEILKVFKEISQLNTMFREQIATFSASIQSATTNIFEEPVRLADFAAAVSAGEELELQEILESLNIEQRLEKSLLVLKKELMNAELQNKISKDVETKIQKRQREYYLMEQLKGIKRELGIDDNRDKLIETLKAKFAEIDAPEEVQRIFHDEINKLSTMETSMSEFGVIRNYLDWIVSLPWNKDSLDQFSITKAKEILDEDHYGMQDVKMRILEFIAVGKLLNKINGKILCFVGPPGVGKTSIGKSIARSLNREFYRFSVGGLQDVAEIKGHRRTYVGALPGRIIQGLKKCQTQNPLILIDEIDKIDDRRSHGDPSAALLEVLDPEQNSSFMDNYLDIPVDLSKVLFVCTANSLDPIPRPLLDRMEVIELSGYVAEEKIKIAENYLAPQAKAASGLQNANIKITDDAIQQLLSFYCRESGVRNLKKHVEKIYRKAALKIVKQLKLDDVDMKTKTQKNEKLQSETSKHETTSTISEQKEETNQNLSELNEESKEVKEKSTVNGGKETPAKSAGLKERSDAGKNNGTASSVHFPSDLKIEVNASTLEDYIGPPVYTTERMFEVTPPGVAMGLGWTSMGGCALYVESVLGQSLSSSSRGSLQKTGNLMQVMEESSMIAYSLAKSYLLKKFPENRFFERAAVHLHCPEGAVKKDGPSAGVTFATSYLSLALNHSVDPTVAMTGELTLSGKVLRIGGLKEKTVAAKRAGAKTVIFPKDNWSDWVELPETVKEGLTPLPADWYSDIFDRLFADISEKEGNEVWKNEFAKLDSINKKKE